jgi:hypothetical protein
MMIRKEEMDRLLKQTYAHVWSFPLYYDEELRVWPRTDRNGEAWKVEVIET